MAKGSEKILSSEAMDKITQDENNLSSVLKEIGAKNTFPHLPPAPYLKEIKTGVIHVWNAGMAKRPDLVVCCDESGNEDPVSWVGGRPIGMRDDGTMPKPDEMPVEAMLLSRKKVADSPLSPVQPHINFDRAATEFGVTKEAKMYAEPVETNSALPFSGMTNSTMEDRIKEIQKITGLIEEE